MTVSLDLATEIFLLTVKSTLKVVWGCKSSPSQKSTVSKMLDFSHVSLQAAQSTRHEQSPEYLRGFTPVKRSLIAKGSHFIKLTKNVKYADKIKSQLDEMGLVTVKPDYDNTDDEQHLNSFFKISADNSDTSDEASSENEPHVQLRHKLITYISNNSSNFAQVILFYG